MKIEMDENAWKRVMAFGVISAAKALVVEPLIVAQAKLQTQTVGSNYKKDNRYMSLTDVLSRESSEKGVMSLWRAAPLSVLVAPVGRIAFEAVSETVDHVVSHSAISEDSKPLAMFIGRIVTGTCGVLLSSALKNAQTLVRTDEAQGVGEALRLLKEKGALFSGLELEGAGRASMHGIQTVLDVSNHPGLLLAAVVMAGTLAYPIDTAINRAVVSKVSGVNKHENSSALKIFLNGPSGLFEGIPAILVSGALQGLVSALLLNTVFTDLYDGEPDVEVAEAPLVDVAPTQSS